MKTYLGTEIGELIKGGFGLDSIDGAGGDDTIRGYQHRDTLIGGEGNDYIVTGAGPDLAYGGSGDDTIYDDYTSGVENLYGGDGDDLIRAFQGAALGPYAERTEWWMFGGNGDDRVIAGEGGTGHLFGGQGDDVLMLNSYGAGEAYGGAGNDKIYSEFRSRINDQVDLEGKYAPGGQAIIDGGTGNDKMWGHFANRDIFVFEPGDGRDVVRNFGSLEWNADVIDLRAFDLGMTAQEVFDTYAFDQGNRIVMNLGPDSKIIIYGAPYDDPGDLAEAVLAGLWV